QIYTLSLHDALPIWALHFLDQRAHSGVRGQPRRQLEGGVLHPGVRQLAQRLRYVRLKLRVGLVQGTDAEEKHLAEREPRAGRGEDRKSTRLNSSHVK